MKKTNSHPKKGTYENINTPALTMKTKQTQKTRHKQNLLKENEG